MEEVIKLKKSNTLRFEIKTYEGESTGEFLEFNMDDIELPLKLNECEARHRKNIENLQGQFVIIDKKEDKKGKYILSWKEEEKIKAIKDFYQKETEALDLFLGKGGTKKLLNGRNPYYEMYDDISEALEPILPKLKQSAESITDRIKSKYSKKENDVLE